MDISNQCEIIWKNDKQFILMILKYELDNQIPIYIVEFYYS